MSYADGEIAALVAYKAEVKRSSDRGRYWGANEVNMYVGFFRGTVDNSYHVYMTSWIDEMSAAWPPCSA